MNRYISESSFVRKCSVEVSNATSISRTDMRRIKAIYGVSPSIMKIIWNNLYNSSSLPHNSNPEYLLYALRFLKTYDTEDVSSSAEKCHEQTFRNWSWVFVELLSDMNLVSI